MKLAPIQSLALALILSACGGGGGSDSPDSPASASSNSSTQVSSSVPSNSSSSSSSNIANESSSSAHSSSLAPNPAASFTPTSVHAGRDRFHVSGDAVVMTAVSEGETGPWAYQWSQLSGEAVNLIDATSARASFTAPTVTEPSQLLFKVVATDKNGDQYQDTLRVNVNAANAAVRYEAEDGVLAGNTHVASEVSGFSGTGYVTGFTNDPSDHVSWTVTIADAGFYRVVIGFYLGNEEKGYHLNIDGQITSGMMIGSGKFDTTSAGNMWLSAGTHTISIGGNWGWYEVDYLDLAPLASPPKPQSLSTTLSNPEASANAQQLFNYLHQQYGKVTISGQQDVEGIDYVQNKTGERPAIYSFDLLDYSPLAVSAAGLPAGKTEGFIDRINTNGHIASLMWHWHSPMHAKSTSGSCPNGGDSCWWNSFYTEHSNFDLSQALADINSAEYQALIGDIDAIAVQLKKVQVADIPVLWRPLHEADGEWFWWGASGAESFKVLWRIMYERLTDHHEINNLVWVWTNEDHDWYPGDDVVDIVGIDVYTDKDDMLTGKWDEIFQRFDGHKLIALTEFGGVPFVAQMQQQGVWWSYFASWTDQYESLGPQKMTDVELSEIYNSPEVIALDELALP